MCVLFLMTDGWSGWCNTTAFAAFPGTHLVSTAKGKFKHEFLLQRALFRTGTHRGADRLLAVVGEPEGLGEGKTAWNIMGGVFKFMKTLRQMGHRGVCGTTYLLDGALSSSVSRKVEALHDTYYELLPPSDEALKLRLQEFIFTIKCVEHGCNSGTRWGIKIVVNKPNLNEELHIYTKSCRNCSSAFHSRIETFLRTNLRFNEHRSGSDDDIQAWWNALQVQPEMVEILIRLDVFWDGQALRVHVFFEDDVTLFGILSTAFYVPDHGDFKSAFQNKLVPC